MIIVRGVNVFPSAIENIMREFIEIEEFKIETFVREELRELKLIIEPGPIALRPSPQGSGGAAVSRAFGAAAGGRECRSWYAAAI